MNSIIKKALTNAAATAAYVVAVSLFINYMSRTMKDEPDTIFVPIAMILLFVSSAAITGYLVLGRPVLMYLEGKKKDAVSLLTYTLAFLVLLTVAAFGLVLTYR